MFQGDPSAVIAPGNKGIPRQKHPRDCARQWNRRWGEGGRGAGGRAGQKGPTHSGVKMVKAMQKRERERRHSGKEKRNPPQSSSTFSRPGSSTFICTLKFFHYWNTLSQGIVRKHSTIYADQQASSINGIANSRNQIKRHPSNIYDPASTRPSLLYSLHNKAEYNQS